MPTCWPKSARRCRARTAEVVSAAIGLDTRIGRKYLKGAFGYGGPCFPRDNTAFARFAEMHAVDATLAKATDQVNQRQVSRLAERILAALPRGRSVGILGMSYKPDTEVIEESQGLMLAQDARGGRMPRGGLRSGGDGECAAGAERARGICAVDGGMRRRRRPCW